MERKCTFAGRSLADSNGQAVGREYVVDDFTPFYYSNVRRVVNDFGQFVSNDTRFVEPVKIEVGNGELWRFVLLRNRECRASDFVFTTRPFGEPTCKGRFAATKIGYEFYNLTAPELTSQLCREGFGLFGAGGNGFPSHVGTHTTYMLPREQPPRQ